jgi:hypothetical protein
LRQFHVGKPFSKYENYLETSILLENLLARRQSQFWKAAKAHNSNKARSLNR